jgi:preprotein translocase subunit SecY
MNKFISTIKNIFSIEELRNRILLTFLLIAVYRLGSHIILPGVDSSRLETGGNGLLDLLNLFSGGAFSKASLMALGIMPYISASIAIQLLTIALPAFQKMQKEGESGRKRLNNITRWLTVVITTVQAFSYIQFSILNSNALLSDVDPVSFRIYSTLILVAGTMFCMWLGEKITDKGIGNGTSMLIMIGIVARFPSSLLAEMQTRGLSGGLLFVIEMLALFFIVMGAVAITQAIRRIPIDYAKQVVKGRSVAGGPRNYLPLKLNMAGVMPIIFSQALMFVPTLVANQFAEKSETAANIAQTFANPLSWSYNILDAVLIIIFTFFYTAISINPVQISDDMKRSGGFVPGIKPGEPTSNFIANVIDRITLPGAILLAIVAILPAVAGAFGVSSGFAQFFGGTSLLILVGVVLDTLQQIESYLLLRKYEGLMQSGRVKGRSEVAAQ